MIEVRQTAAFSDWLANLGDRRALARIAERLFRVQSGHLGDVKYFEGIGEMRMDFGPGYRVYFVQQGRHIVLLCGGDKDSQRRDIKRAIGIAREMQR